MRIQTSSLPKWCLLLSVWFRPCKPQSNTYGLIVIPNGDPSPTANETATMLYVNAHQIFVEICRIVESAISIRMSKDSSCDRSSNTLPPDDRHFRPCAIMMPMSAAARLGPSFMPSPTCAFPSASVQPWSVCKDTLAYHENLVPLILQTFDVFQLRSRRRCRCLNWYA